MIQEAAHDDLAPLSLSAWGEGTPLVCVQHACRMGEVAFVAIDEGPLIRPLATFSPGGEGQDYGRGRGVKVGWSLDVVMPNVLRDDLARLPLSAWGEGTPIACVQHACRMGEVTFVAFDKGPLIRPSATFSPGGEGQRNDTADRLSLALEGEGARRAGEGDFLGASETE